MLFLSPRGIGRSERQAAGQQISRQWWRSLVSPVSRNHLWLTNGLATYSVALCEHLSDRARSSCSFAIRKWNRSPSTTCH
jgi:hypothetical protein